MIGSLLPVFGGRTPVFAADTPEAREVVAGFHEPVLSVQELLDQAPPDVVIVLSDLATLRTRYPDLRNRIGTSRALVLPQSSFDGAPETIRYSLELAAASDFEAAVARNRAWREAFLRTPSPLTFVHPGHSDQALSCTLLGDVKVSATVDVELPPGTWRAMGSYFEVEMEVLDRKARYFSLDGVLPVGGLVTAKAPTMEPDLEFHHGDMLRLVQELSGQEGEAVLVDNRLESVVIGGQDVTKEILTASGDRYGYNVLEFSLGTNRPATTIDWSVNSSINEGVAGVHVAVGDGVFGAHVDLIAPDVGLVR